MFSQTRFFDCLGKNNKVWFISELKEKLESRTVRQNLDGRYSVLYNGDTVNSRAANRCKLTSMVVT